MNSIGSPSVEFRMAFTDIIGVGGSAKVCSTEVPRGILSRESGSG